MVGTSKAVQPDEEHIKLGFLGSEVERENAWNQLWQMYSSQLMGYVEAEFRALPKDLAANAVLDGYRQLSEKIEADQFDLDKPLLPWLYRVCYCRAADEMRKRVRRPLHGADLLDCIGDDLEATEVGTDWQKLARQEQAKEVGEVFRATLHEFQRQVAQVEADFYPSKPTREEVCDEIFRRTGKRPTVIAVKSARAQYMQKLRSFIKNQNRKPI